MAESDNLRGPGLDDIRVRIGLYAVAAFCAFAVFRELTRDAGGSAGVCGTILTQSSFTPECNAAISYSWWYVVIGLLVGLFCPLLPTFGPALDRRHAPR